LQNTEVTDISSVTAVTETIEIETSTDRQEKKELKGIKIENETLLLDSIMNQLLSFNISSLETLKEKYNGKYTGVFSTEETLLETTVMVMLMLPCQIKTLIWKTIIMLLRLNQT
jgi:hypothetical protein